MPRLTRRTFVAGTAVLPFVVWAQRYAGAAAPRVRYDVRSPQGKAMLQIYALAVGKMKATQDCDPRSWVFQWYTHWVKGQGTPAEKTAAIAEIFSKPGCNAFWRSLGQTVWDTCQPHFGGTPSMFCPWHRMYVYFFEKIIREVSGNDTFTLPYWNYSTSDTTIRGVLPPEFGTGGLPQLYVDKRNPGVNGGRPIQQGQPNDPLSLDSLLQCAYDPQGVEPGFNDKLDNGLHGNVHDLVGNGQNMGAVPWAAGDPIFWMHHSNIDRLWASWNAGGRTNPTNPSFLSRTFTFADANGTGVVAKVSDFLDITTLGYSYERLEPVAPCARSVPELRQSATTLKRRAAVKAPVALGAGPVRVNLEPAAEAGAKAATLGAHIQAINDKRRLYLVVRGLHAAAVTGVLYHLYLELPSGEAPEKHEDLHIGEISFFDAVGHHEHAAKGGEPAPFLSFDVTDLAKRLQSQKLLGAAPSVTFVPAGQPAANAKPVVGEISLVEQ